MPSVVGVGGDLKSPYGGDFLIFVLKLIKLPVDSALCQEFLVSADFTKPALMHHNDFVSALHS